MTEIGEFYERYPYPYAGNYQNLKNYSAVTAPLQAKGDILVVGCGTVEASMVAIHNPDATVYGIDLSHTSIKIAKSIKRHYHVRNLHLWQDDICNLQFGAIRFDYVVASGVLHHIPNIDQAMKEIRRVLKPGGKLGGMVYSTNRPEYIRTVNEYAKANRLSVDDLRKVLEELDPAWIKIFQSHEIELADTWLHPYYVEYDETKLREMLDGFELQECDFWGPFEDRLIFKAELKKPLH